MERIEQIMQDACADFGTKLVELAGMRARAPTGVLPPCGHLLLVSNLKGVSSRRLRTESPNGGNH